MSLPPSYTCPNSFPVPPTKPDWKSKKTRRTFLQVGEERLNINRVISCSWELWPEPSGTWQVTAPGALHQSESPTLGFYTRLNLKAASWLVERARCVEQRTGLYSDGPQLAVRHRAGRWCPVMCNWQKWTAVNGFACDSLKERKKSEVGSWQDGRSSEWGDFPGAAGRPRHGLLLRAGQPRGGLAAGLLQPQLWHVQIQNQIQKQIQTQMGI